MRAWADSQTLQLPFFSENLGGLLGISTPLIPCLLMFCPDTNSRVSEPLRSIFPEMQSDSASKDLPGRILLDMDNDTESTAL